MLVTLTVRADFLTHEVEAWATNLGEWTGMAPKTVPSSLDRLWEAALRPAIDKAG